MYNASLVHCIHVLRIYLNHWIEMNIASTQLYYTIHAKDFAFINKMPMISRYGWFEMFPQKHLYYCSIGLVRPANQGKNIFFQLQSQNMHHAVKYNMHYTMSTFLSTQYFLECCTCSKWICNMVCFRKRDRSSTFMSSNTSWHQCTSCCDIGNHAEYNRTGITISSLFLKLDNIYFA